jgi:hypothetical protein
MPFRNLNKTINKESFQMKKDELVSKVRAHVASGSARKRGEKSFLSFFAEFLANLDIPADREYDHWHIDPYLPEIIAAAHERFRQGNDASAKKWRAEYEKDTGHRVPHLTDIGENPIVDQALEVGCIAHAFERVMGEDRGDYVCRSIETYCNAQAVLVQQTFDMFARRVYQQGLFEIIRDCQGRGMNGGFGKTWLRSYIIAGRIMFTFCRERGKELEAQVSFVGEDTDPLLLSAGIQSIDANVHLCMEMMMDVVQNWPVSIHDRKKIFIGDETVKLDVVAAMETAHV